MHGVITAKRGAYLQTWQHPIGWFRWVKKLILIFLVQYITRDPSFESMMDDAFTPLQLFCGHSCRTMLLNNVTILSSDFYTRHKQEERKRGSVRQLWAGTCDKDCAIVVQKTVLVFENSNVSCILGKRLFLHCHCAPPNCNSRGSSQKNTTSTSLSFTHSFL